MTESASRSPRPQQPSAAYVHVPFCRHRCGYCNFTLIAGRDYLIDGYLEALERELSLLETPRPVETIFLGGGTPSHLPPDALRRLMRLVEHWFPLAAGGEFSMEANPLDLTAERLRELESSAVTRISVGVQSFQSDKLRVLERDMAVRTRGRSCETWLIARAGVVPSISSSALPAKRSKIGVATWKRPCCCDRTISRFMASPSNAVRRSGRVV